MSKSIFILLFAITFQFELLAQGFQVRNIYIETKKVFEPDDKDWFFASDFLNFFHHTTRKYVIEDELLFKPNSITDEDYIYETERNLRKRSLFSSINIELDSIGFNSYDVYVTTKDRWSLYPSIPFGTGGGEYKYGLKLEEYNFLGTGTYLKGELLYRSENNIGLSSQFYLDKKRFLRTPFNLELNLYSSKIKTNQQLNFSKPYFNLDTKYSYGIYLNNSFGQTYLYNQVEENKIVDYSSQDFKLFFSRSWYRFDKIFFNAAIELNNSEIKSHNLRRAFDNSGKLLIMFSSLSQKFYPVNKVNYYHTEDIPIGGYGSATLGKIFPIADKDGDNSYYVAGQGEISYYDGHIYLFGQLTGSSSFIKSKGRYTYQEFLGLGFYRITENLLLTARIYQQTTWNWDAFRQLLLDNDRGLRGYDLNKLWGDNRIINNIELRYFPNLPLFVFNFSGVLFADIGTVWNQEQKITETQFYSSVGAGLRLHFTKSSDGGQTIRIDFAYNLYEKKFGGIIISTKQLFSAFGEHTYKIPKVFGNDFDVE